MQIGCISKVEFISALELWPKTHQLDATYHFLLLVMHDTYLASFPVLPHFYLSSAFVCIHNNMLSGRSQKTGSIYYVNDIRLTRGGCREGGAQLPKQCTGSSVWALDLSFGLQTLAWSKLIVLTGEKILVGTYLIINSSPSMSTSTTHVMNAPRPFQFFTSLSSHVAIINIVNPNKR